VVDYSLGAVHERPDPADEVPRNVVLVAPAIGESVVVVNRGLPEGSVFLAGEYDEGTDYTLAYGSSSVSLTNLAITPGTPLDVVYYAEPTGSPGGLVGVLNDLEDVIVTNPRVGQALYFDGTYWRNAYEDGAMFAAVVAGEDFVVTSGDDDVIVGEG
jgi:hypothetical protein